MKKYSLSLITLLLLAQLTSLDAADAAKLKPNILILYADDLGYGDVQCYNSKRGKIPTPHIDALATQGMRFTDGHSSSGVCTPSRYTLLTGRYHWRTQLQSGIVGVFGEPLIAADRVTVGTLAKQHGYRTAAIGKWHLGWNWPVTEEQRPLLKPSPKLLDDASNADKKAAEAEAIATQEQIAAWRDIFSKSIDGGPTTRGFDSYFGTDIPNWPPFCFIENNRTVGIPSEFLPARLLKNNQASNQGPALNDWTLEPILPTLGDRAAAFITDAAKKPEPFLLYLPFTSPHTPLSVNDEWKGKSGLNLYADLVMETDAVVGRVLTALDQSGATDNTLVIFTSDNGCAPYIGKPDLEMMGHYPSGPLRGAKADAWEGGHRVPFIIRWPNNVQPGSTCDQLVHQADLMATIAEILGTTLPSNVGEDSFSLVPLLKGEDRPIREHAVSASIRGVPAIRSGSWKYIPAPDSGGWGTGGDQSQPVQLYNLADDIAETTNLAAAMPETVADMKALLEKLITNGRSTPGAHQPNDVEVKRYPANLTSTRNKKTNVSK